MDESVGGKFPEVPRHVLKVSPTNNEHSKTYDNSDKEASGIFWRKNHQLLKNEDSFGGTDLLFFLHSCFIGGKVVYIYKQELFNSCVVFFGTLEQKWSISSIFSRVVFKNCPQGVPLQFQGASFGATFWVICLSEV